MIGGLGGAMKFAVLYRAIDQFSDPVRRMAGETESLTRAMEGAQRARRTATVFSGLAAGAGAAATGVAALVSHLADPDGLEDALAAAQTVWTPVGESMGESMSRLRDAAAEWSDAHKGTATDFVAASYQMGSAGLDATAAIEGTRAALGLGTATFADATSSANLLAVAYNTLGDKSAPAREEMERISDLLAKTQQQFQIANLQQLGDGLSYAIPAAQGARQSLEEVAATVGQLNSLGLQGSRAGTAYAALVGNMGRASDELGMVWPTDDRGAIRMMWAINNIRARFGDLGEAGDEVQAKLRKAFGDEGFRALLLLGNAAADWGLGLEAVQRSAGTVGKTLQILEDTPSAQWQILSQQVANTWRLLGQELLPSVSELQSSIFRVIERVREWVREHPEMARWGADALVFAGKVFAVTAAVTGAIAAVSWLWAAWKSVLLLLTGTAALRVAVSWLGLLGNTARAVAGASLAALGKGLWGITVWLGKMAVAAVRAALAFAFTPVGMLTTALGGLALAIYKVANGWEELTGQNNRMVKVAPGMVDALRHNTSIRQEFLDKAKAGDVAARQILNTALDDTFDDAFWKEHDQQRRAKNQAALREELGMEASTAMGMAGFGGDAAAMQSSLLEQAKAFGIDIGGGGDAAAMPPMPPDLAGPGSAPPPDWQSWLGGGADADAGATAKRLEAQIAASGPAADTRQDRSVSLTQHITIHEAVDVEKIVREVTRRMAEGLEVGA